MCARDFGCAKQRSSLVGGQHELQKHRFLLRFGIQVRGYEAQFGVPGGVPTKKQQGVKIRRIFRPDLEAKLASKKLIYVARRAQEPSGEALGGIFLRVKN